MGRLIDGDALVNTLKGLRALANILSGSRERPTIPYDDMVRMIEKSPTIEPDWDAIWDSLSKVYNMKDVPDEAKGIIGDLMLNLDGEEGE